MAQTDILEKGKAGHSVGGRAVNTGMTAVTFTVNTGLAQYYYGGTTQYYCGGTGALIGDNRQTMSGVTQTADTALTAYSNDLDEWIEEILDFEIAKKRRSTFQEGSSWRDLKKELGL